jgi:SAM-dependent methyltransferase
VKCRLCASAGERLYSNVQDLLFGSSGSWSYSKCVNPECRLIWIDPPPNERELAEAYGAYYTHASLPAPPRWLTRAREDTLARNLGYPTSRTFGGKLISAAHPGGRDEFEAAAMFVPFQRKGARLLDVGCGSGDHLLFLQSLGWETVGVDTDSRAVGHARDRGIDVRLGDLDAQGFADASFDAVVMSHVIEHVFEPEVLLSQARTLLRPGGTLVLLTPNTDSWGHRKYQADWRGMEPPRHLFLYNGSNIRRLLSRSGFETFRVRTLARAARSIVSLSEALRWSRMTGRPVEAFPPVRRKLLGISQQLRERAIMRRDPTAGEELLVQAETDA